MQKLKIKIIDKYCSFKYKQSIQYKVLKKIYNVELVDDNPDVIVSILFGDTHLDYDEPKIFFTAESYQSNPNYADITFCPNNYRRYDVMQYSFMFAYAGFKGLLKGIKHNFSKVKKTKFCAFMYANPKAKARNVFCTKLMDYKKVDCLGAVMRNTDIIIPKYLLPEVEAWANEQLQIYKDYKFTIAFENTSAYGYVSEKILQPLLVGSIPIYWGANDIKDFINPECFINVNDFDSFEDCIEYVKKVDNDDELYKKYLNAQPILPDSRLFEMTDEPVSNWLKPRLDALLNNPDKRVGKIGFFGKCKYRIWQKYTKRINREKQKWLFNVKMPIWEKIKWVIKKV